MKREEGKKKEKGQARELPQLYPTIRPSKVEERKKIHARKLTVFHHGSE